MKHTHTGENRELWMQGMLNECTECAGAGYVPERVGNTYKTETCRTCNGTGKAITVGKAANDD